MSAHNRSLLDSLKKFLGFRPNLYTYMARNETALGDYLAFQNRKSTMSAKEREVINLAVSQVNHCAYCLAAHTAIAHSLGFTAEQILDIRAGRAPFDDKLDTLARFVQETTLRRGHPTPETVDALFVAGYTEANLVDILIVIGDKTISNYLHGVTQVPVDFPAAPELKGAEA